jgi:endonuclease YncB( thermonuclease family)
MTTAISRKNKTTLSQSLKTYTALRTAVRQTIELGKQRAVQALDREKVRTSWEIGKLILEHILLNQSRADYGEKVIEKLSKDLGVSVREINYMLEFAREYPIQPTSAKLSWSHYRELLSVNKSETRKQLTSQTAKNDWTILELRSEIKKIKTVAKMPKKTETLKAVTPAALDVFRTREVSGKTVIDLGFSTYLEKSSANKKLSFVKDRNFTYRAELESVVDGDTLWCVVYLGLGVKTRQKLRLAKINAPELDSKEGQAAKKFLSKKIEKGSQIILSTTKSDKYDRYLADIWFKAELDNPKKTKNDLIPNPKENWEYLNLVLVENGFARAVA